jgi:hypothetical protein
LSSTFAIVKAPHFDNGRLAVWLWKFLSPVAGNQQLIRAKGTDPGSS